MIQEPLSQYYTPDWVCNELVVELGRQRPSTIIDLGCGAGALAYAARKKWESAGIVTVDINQGVDSRLNDLKNKSGFHRHVVADALDCRLGDRAKIKPNSIDLAVCNPPFHRPIWRRGFGVILEQAGLSHTFKHERDVTADLLFIAQNLRYLDQNGSMGLIVPDGIVSGERLARVRQTLAPRIEKVVQLPRRVFTGTDAQTFIIILSLGKRSDTVALSELNIDGSRSETISLGLDEAAIRLDYKFHALRNKRLRSNKKLVTLRELGVEIRRGNISTNQIKLCKRAIFHTSNFQGAAEVCFPTKLRRPLPKLAVVASAGDILIARVDRRLEKKVSLVKRGEQEISDCVYRLRCPKEVQARVFTGLRSSTGQKQIVAATHGTGARHISMTSLLNIRV